MKYGLIGERLSHSFSKDIHGKLADYNYELCEIQRDELDTFMKKRDFLGINVTIPYKSAVIPYLDYIDGSAKEIGAVNTVVKRGDKLYGYNTDYYGMLALCSHAGVSLADKRVAILGTGGTSRTALCAARNSGAKSIIRVSRTAKDGAVSYEDFYKNHRDTEVIINTTPVGMSPNIFDTPVSLSGFDCLSGVIDAIYNPLRTPLIMSAKGLGISASGGLYMVVAQAVRASEIFLDTKYPDGIIEEIYRSMLKEKESIVLTGMPGAGKSTVGRLLSERLGRKFVDTDALIEEHAGKSITEIFENHGEEYFRDLESSVIAEVSGMCGAVISVGGGAVLRGKNLSALKENGRLYFIDRPLSALIPTDDRPLAKSREAIEKRYKERYGIYIGTADCKIDADCDADGVRERIERNFGI